VKNGTALFSVALFVLLFSVLFLSPYWHSLDRQGEVISYSLQSYDRSTNEAQSCFTLGITASGLSTEKREALSVAVHGKTLLAETISFTESTEKEFCYSTMELAEMNMIEVFVAGQHLFYHLEKGEMEKIVPALIEETEQEEVFSLPLAAGIFLLAIAFFAFNSFVFGKHSLVNGSALSLALIYCLLSVNAFVLDLIEVLTAQSAAVVFLVEILILVFYFKKNFSLKEIKKEKINLIEIGLVLFFLAVTIALPLFLPSNQTAWSVYYERQSNTIGTDYGIPATDELSYLGRNFTFTPGYFLFGGSLHWFTGAIGQDLFALSMAFSNLFLLFSALFFAERIKLERKYAALFVAFLVMSTFVFTTVTLTPRHAIALSLTFVSLGLFLGKEKWWLSSIFLGIGFFTQVPLMAFWPFLALVFAGKDKWREIVKVFALALVIFAPLYAFIPLNNGLPFQSMSTTWGYFISLPVISLFSNPGIQFIFLCAFLGFELFLLYAKKAKWSKRKKQLFALVLLSSMIQVFVSSRWDFVLAVMIASFIAFSLQEYGKQFSEFAEFIASLILLMGLFLVATTMPDYILSEPMQQSFDWIAENSAPQDIVLSDPYYSHMIALHSERPLVSDLMVEYADPEMLADSYRFFDEEDYSILEKYNVSLVFAENWFIHNSLVETENKEIEFTELDKVFSNDLISVHRVTQ